MSDAKPVTHAQRAPHTASTLAVRSGAAQLEGLKGQDVGKNALAFAGNLAIQRTIQRTCAGSCLPAEPCNSCTTENPAAGIQRRSSGPQSARSSPPVPVVRVLSSSGTPLDPSIRKPLERSARTNFSSVQIIQGSDAERAAESISSRAFTAGDRIVMGKGINLGSREGAAIIAHELAHVVQQRQGRVPQSWIDRGPSDPLEIEAERFASGHAIAPSGENGRSGTHVQRFPSVKELGDMACSVTSAAAESEVGQRQVAAQAWDAAGNLVDRGEKAVANTWNDVVSSSPVQKASGLLSGASSWVFEKAAAAKNTVMQNDTVKAAAAYGGRALDQASQVGSELWGAAKTGAARAGSWIADKSSLLLPLLGPLAPVIPMLTGLRKLYENQDAVIEGLHQALGAMIETVPEKLKTYLGRAEAQFKNLSVTKHLEGIWGYLGPALAHLKTNWWKELKNLGWTLLWPWPSVWKDMGSIWSLQDDMLEHLRKCEISEAIDKAIEIAQKVNGILGNLFGWFLLASVLIGAIIGAFFGGAGAIPGAIAGAEAAGSVGEVFLGMLVVTEYANIGKAVVDLDMEVPPARQDSAYQRIAGSILTLSITGALMLLGELATKLASAIWDGASSLFRRTGRATEGEGPKGSGIGAPDEPMFEEPLSDHGRAQVDEDGTIELCHSPCKRCENVLAESDMDPALARNFRQHLNVLQEAIEEAQRNGATRTEIQERFGSSIRELADQIDAADAGDVGGGSEGGRRGSSEPGSLFDDPQQPHKFDVEDAQKGTAYHDLLEKVIVDELPPNTAFTENTFGDFCKQIGIDPPFAKSAGPDVYVVDWSAKRIRAFDLTRSAEKGGHFAKGEAYGDILTKNFSGSGWTVDGSVPELLYEGMSQDTAAEAVTRLLRGYAVPKT